MTATVSDEEGRASLRVVGDCRNRLFGILPAGRLARQIADRTGGVLVADASAVLCDAAVDHLFDHPGQVLASPAGRRLAVFVPPARAADAEVAIAGGSADFPSIDAAAAPDHFVRKLRRRDTLLARSVAEDSVPQLEWLLFAKAYKGVTDLVTKWVWPVPAFWAVRGLSRLGVSPNAVTLVGVLLTVVAALLFYRGDLGWGLAAAWLMTFLDTVDGKLARVTLTSSPLGNLLDHVTDYLHPPVWWLCLAVGLSRAAPDGGERAGAAGIVILAAYVIGRGTEELFKRRIGFNPYLWRRFDSLFRLVISRRNVILLIVTAGLAVGAPQGAFVFCAGWSLVSVTIQIVRLFQAVRAARAGPLSSWLM